jgi:Protein of unknown function (DUF3754)
VAEYKDREHYIPLRKSDLVNLLCREHGMQPEDAEQFRQFALLTSSVFHFEFHQKLEELKEEYAAFDPDSTTKQLQEVPAQERAERLDKLLGRFAWLMERANFRRVDRATIEAALDDHSGWGLNMVIDYSIFERLEVFIRGDTIGSRWKRPWWYVGRPREIKLPVYQRLVLIAKLKEHVKLPESVDTKAVFLKIFKDIPKVDLEMLLPGARMRMPSLQRWKLGGSLLSGLSLIVYNIVNSILTTGLAAVEALLYILLAIFGYAYKQYYGYQTTRTAYSLQLTQSLYYQNLDNNAGVLFHLLDEAEEQECREVLLAYYYLWRVAGAEGWTAAALDDFVEEDLERLTTLKVDFEIGDALAKLERLELATRHENRFCAVPIDKALEKLDYIWDNYFKYNKTASP